MSIIEEIEERVNRLENVLGRFIVHTDISLNRLSEGMDKFREEMEKDRKERKEEREERAKDRIEWEKKMEEDREEWKRGLEKDRVEWERKMGEDRKKSSEEWEKKMGEDREERKKSNEEWKKRMGEDREERKKSNEEWEKRIEEDREERKKNNEEWKKKMEEWERKREEERREWRRDMNKEWAAMAKKMGTIDEDLVAPAVRPVLGKYFNCEINIRTIRVLKRLNGEDFEVDVLAVSDDKVFMIEVKSSPRSEYVAEILGKAGQFKRFFPEYKDKELIPIYASIIFSDNIVKHATRNVLYVMAYREWEYMDIMNFDEVTKMRQ